MERHFAKSTREEATLAVSLTHILASSRICVEDVRAHAIKHIFQLWQHLTEKEITR